MLIRFASSSRSSHSLGTTVQIPLPALPLRLAGLLLEHLLHQRRIDAQLLNVDIVLVIHHATTCFAASRFATSFITRSHITAPRGSW